MTDPHPIYFSTLELENVRCFGGRQKLFLTGDDGRPAKWSLIIGENGAGKTTLLECLAWMRPVPNVDGPAGYTTDPDYPVKAALTGEENDVLETLPKKGYREAHINAMLSCGVGLESKEVSNGASSKAPNVQVGIQLTFNEQAGLEAWDPLGEASLPTTDGYPLAPLIVTYGANRHLGNRNLLGAYEPETSDHVRLSVDTELCGIDGILMDLDYAAKTCPSGPEARSLELLKRTISRILPGENDDGMIQIHPPDVLETGRDSGVYVETFTGQVRMSALGLGYQTTASWVMDLAWRFVNQYPKSPMPLHEPAVVLIDEIDLHLHPKWQRHIMEDLASLFPATQFIATSHSPLIVQAAETANIVLLQKRDAGVDIVNYPGVSRDLRVDQILTSLLFGMETARSERIERLFAKREELVDKMDRSHEEEDLLKDIRRQIAELPTAEYESDRKAMDIIQRFAASLENEERTIL